MTAFTVQATFALQQGDLKSSHRVTDGKEFHMMIDDHDVIVLDDFGSLLMMVSVKTESHNTALARALAVLREAVAQMVIRVDQSLPNPYRIEIVDPALLWKHQGELKSAKEGGALVSKKLKHDLDFDVRVGQ